MVDVEDETTSDETYTRRHLQPELEERKRFSSYKKSVWSQNRRLSEVPAAFMAPNSSSTDSLMQLNLPQPVSMSQLCTGNSNLSSTSYPFPPESAPPVLPSPSSADTLSLSTIPSDAFMFAAYSSRPLAFAPFESRQFPLSESSWKSIQVESIMVDAASKSPVTRRNTVAACGNADMQPADIDGPSELVNSHLYTTSAD